MQQKIRYLRNGSQTVYEYEFKDRRTGVYDALRKILKAGPRLSMGNRYEHRNKRTFASIELLARARATGNAWKGQRRQMAAERLKVGIPL
ncbi:MAG: hypothetical protein L6406_24670 [Desulfobacterales bacterium]|nr:hypothetical protein [Desulfobacterales bacterium]